MYGKSPDLFLNEDQRALRSTVERLTAERVAPRAAEIDRNAEFPRDIFELLRQQGIIGMTLPEKYGGGGASQVDLCIVTAELGRACTASALLPVMNNILGVMLVNHGSPEQKEQYLRPLAEGRITFSNAITEPNAGSDLSAMTSRADRTADGYVLNGAKCWITCAGISDYYITFARLFDGDTKVGITAFIVPRDAPGVSTGKHEHKMGIRGMPSAEVHFKDVRVPADAVLGQPGGGMKVVLDSMTRNRPAIGARCVGLAQGAFDIALAHCKTRKAFGGRLMDLQGLQFKLADMATDIEASRQMVHRAAALIDEGVDPRNILGFLSMGKMFASDACMRVSIEAVQLLGAYGYSQEFPLERFMRDAKHLQIVDGSNEIQRVLIARALDS